jgi:hypothetical protein
MKKKLCMWKAPALGQFFASTQDGSLEQDFNKMEIFIYDAIFPFK